MSQIAILPNCEIAVSIRGPRSVNCSLQPATCDVVVFSYELHCCIAKLPLLPVICDRELRRAPCSLFFPAYLSHFSLEFFQPG